MGEATFDGRMIGPQGRVVTYPRWFYLVLIQAHKHLVRTARERSLVLGVTVAPVRILARDKQSGFWRVLPEAYHQLAALLESPNYRPRRSLRAFDPGYKSGRPRRCGRRGLIALFESGIDPTRGEIEQCEADLEHSRISEVRLAQILEEAQQLRVGQNPGVNLHGRPGESI